MLLEDKVAYLENKVNKMESVYEDLFKEMVGQLQGTQKMFFDYMETVNKCLQEIPNEIGKAIVNELTLQGRGISQSHE